MSELEGDDDIVAPPGAVRPPATVTPSGVPLSSGLIRSINETLNAIEDRSVAVIIQVPVAEHGRRVLKGQVFVDLGKGLSFTTWLDKNLDGKSGLGYGVAVRKKLGKR
jgi:hypothetical protein